MLRTVVALAFLQLSCLAHSELPLLKRASGVTTNPSLASGKTFDYIVVGGGLAGLTVASRLSENSAVTVLVIEAGTDNRNDPRVFDIYEFTQAYFSDIDWSWKCDQGRTMHGGKTLGGGTSINGMVWTRGLAAQYDAWSELLEPAEASVGWNWDNLFTYMKKAEDFSAPNSQQKAKGATSVSSFHGTSGPVQVTFPDAIYGGPQQPDFAQTVSNVTGLVHSADLSGGSPNCVAFVPHSINWHDSDDRSSAATAYLSPVESDRTNWLTLTKYQVTKLLFKSNSLPLVVTGVQFKESNNTGSTFTAFASREVILAAGAIQTPALLQLSGIGDAAYLKTLGITSVLNIPTVGKNLQEQAQNAFGATSTNFNVDGKGPSDVIAYPNIYQAFGSNATSAVNTITTSLSSWAESQATNAANASALETIYGIQAGLIVKQNAPIMEVKWDTGYPAGLGILMWNLLPFSRGNVKITSTNALTKPSVTVNYFSIDFDLQVQVAGARLARKILSSAPLNALSEGETVPGSAVPNTNGNGGTDAAWRTWIQNNFDSVSHPIATCAMMRQELGGVVDANLRVYDTSNLRIVDASIIPLQISAHLQSTLYGVAEKAADIIKSGQ